MAKLSLRQPRLAQAVEQVLGVLGAPERGQLRLRVNRPFGVDPQNLGSLCSSLFDVSQLGMGSSEKDAGGAEIRRPRSALPQQGQRLRIVPEQIVGERQESRRYGRIERIQPHMPLAGLDSPHWVSCKHEN